MHNTYGQDWRVKHPKDVNSQFNISGTHISISCPVDGERVSCPPMGGN